MATQALFFADFLELKLLRFRRMVGGSAMAGLTTHLGKLPRLERRKTTFRFETNGVAADTIGISVVLNDF